MTIPSRLDRNSHPGPPRFIPCAAFKKLDDGKVERCEGFAGHEGPHHVRLTYTWETTKGERHEQRRQTIQPGPSAQAGVSTGAGELEPETRDAAG